MTPEERQMLADLFERIRGAAATPRDPQAEAFINDAVRAAPFAPYVLAQTVLVQQHALEGAAQRIAELEAQAKTSAQQPAQDTSFLGSLGRTIFGGPSAPPPQQQTPRGYDASGYQRPPGPAPQPGYPQPPQGYPPQQGPWGAPPAAQGGGFLSNALHTATGVAGGLLAANAIEGLLGGRSGMFGGSGLGGLGGVGGFGGARGETINNYYEAPADQRSRDVQQDADQDQDDAQDADQQQDDAQDAGYDDGGGFDDSGSYDT
jgi:uncharacterized protein